jgi:hypothetical protein
LKKKVENQEKRIQSQETKIKSQGIKIINLEKQNQGKETKG